MRKHTLNPYFNGYVLSLSYTIFLRSFRYSLFNSNAMKFEITFKLTPNLGYTTISHSNITKITSSLGSEKVTMRSNME